MRRSESKPLLKGNILNLISSVSFDPNKIFIASVFNIVARVVRESGNVTSLEIKSTRGTVSDKDCGFRLSLVEVEPLLSLYQNR